MTIPARGTRSTTASLRARPLHRCFPPRADLEGEHHPLLDLVAPLEDALEGLLHLLGPDRGEEAEATEVHPEGRDRVPGEAPRRSEDRAVPAEDEEEVGLEPVEPGPVQLDAHDLDATPQPGEEVVEDGADGPLAAVAEDVDAHQPSRRAISSATAAPSRPAPRS
ncbi:MAG TPA: hypothetical protein VKF62_08040 [Planctomycetota bacterium]|nr:hypothetical protein [Planctomycetota bacterium]